MKWMFWVMAVLGGALACFTACSGQEDDDSGGGPDDSAADRAHIAYYNFAGLWYGTVGLDAVR